MNRREQQFVATVLQYYKEHGRQSLPWRKTYNPYRIVVSELMLQQTQVVRVLAKYEAFLKQFPTAEVLADAALADVLIAWQGLGYNRRAKSLHECAKVVVKELGGHWPRGFVGLVALPGIGPYTASAVLAFAYNIPTPLIETNVRTVYIHHFFPDALSVPDSDLLPIIIRTIDTKNPRAWYAALMDYGSYLKVTIGNKSRASKHHVKQSTFTGSNRQIRGAIIRTLGIALFTKQKLVQTLEMFEEVRVHEQLEKLIAEGMVVKKGQKFSLPS